MRKNNGLAKKITITAAIAVFALGAGCAIKVAGGANSSNNVAVNVVAAGNDNIVIEQGTALEATERETVAVKEVETTTVATTEAPVETKAEVQTEVQTETQAETQTEAPVQAVAADEPATPAPTEAPVVEETQAPVVETQAPVVIDSRITEVIAGINAERAAAGVGSVTYDGTLTTMAQVRATENANNNFFVVENGKHKRPDGRNASSICEDYAQYGYFGEVMGRYQDTPAEIVLGWHNSATHYSCMTSAKYNRVGVGVAADANGNLYWVAILMD